MSFVQITLKVNATILLNGLQESGKCLTESGFQGINSLAVQWLGLRALTAKGTGSISGWGTKIPQDEQ